MQATATARGRRSVETRGLNDSSQPHTIRSGKLASVHQVIIHAQQAIHTPIHTLDAPPSLRSHQPSPAPSFAPANPPPSRRSVQGNPFIYLAVYSSVAVYEMMVRGIGVMRRRSDSYFNATQILKVAGVEKGKRTKILERDIAQGPHEKVQGGYGRYQGTWSVKRGQGGDIARGLVRAALPHGLRQSY